MTRTARGVILVGLLAAVGVVVAAVLVTRGDTGPAPADATDRSAPSSPSVSAVAAPAPVPTAQAGPTGPVATDPAPAVTGGNVTPVIGYAEWDAAGNRVVAAGFVPGVVESGGTCTLTLENAGTTVEVTSTAEADATTTNCGALAVPRGKLVAGTWQVTLGYDSAGSHGTSQPATVEVPA